MSLFKLLGTEPCWLSLLTVFFSFDTASVFSPGAVPMSHSFRVSRTPETARNSETVG